MQSSGKTLYDESRFRAAVHACWTGRRTAQEKQEAAGDIQDVGLRSGVTAGRHLDPMTEIVGKVFLDAGMPLTALNFQSRVELPGFYRAEKQWDLVVIYRGELVAAVELKSILGSYGNNLNNRVEEAIGNAQDLLEAYEEGLLGSRARAPWLGYLFIIQNDEQSSKPVKNREPHYPVEAAFRNASYQQRVELLCRRLLQKRLYSGACFIRSDGTGPEAVEEPADDLTFAKFAAGIHGRVGEVLA